MTRQLSTEEIEKLFAFVESKNVYWKDVQYEIVDHLASEIEEKMSLNPELSFNRALDEVYSKFPITGFVHMIDSQEKLMKKLWRKRILFLAVEYFKLPKLIITASLIFIMLQMVQNFHIAGWWSVYLITLLCVFTGYIVRKRRGDYQKENPTNQLMFAKTMKSLNTGMDISLLLIPLQTFNYLNTALNYSLFVYITIIFLGLTMMWTHAQVYRVPDLIKEEYNRKYSHLNIKLA